MRKICQLLQTNLKEALKLKLMVSIAVFLPSSKLTLEGTLKRPDSSVADTFTVCAPSVFTRFTYTCTLFWFSAKRKSALDSLEK